MGKYLLRRGAWFIVVALSIITMTFVLSRVIPADPARLAAGLDATPEQVAEVRHVMGLDQPLYAQYGRYLWGLLHWDLGRSVQSRQPVANDVRQFLPATLELVLTSFAVYVVLGISLGVVWAVWPRSWVARAIRFLAVSGAAVPVFWVGLMLQLVLGTKLAWLPVAGRLNTNETMPQFLTGFYTIDSLVTGRLDLFLSTLSHMVMPVAALVFGMIAVATRLTKETVLQELGKDYVRTARAKGVGGKGLIFKHVLKNSLNPVVTMLGMQFGWLLGGTIIVEVVFSWPGIGLYAFNSFRTFDYDPIMAIALISTVVFFIVNTLVDLLYPILDPRVGVE